MVDGLVKAGIIKSTNIRKAMEQVPRHSFLDNCQRELAYHDSPQSIACNQTISAPHMNAIMCECLNIKENHRILEIGTGSGYNAAILASLVGTGGFVYTIERHSDLAMKAKQKISLLNYSNIEVLIGDGTEGYQKAAPFDRIIVTAASPIIPPPLLDQLSKDHGKLCIPIRGEKHGQKLILVTKINDQWEERKISDVIFVPLIGKFGFSQ